MSDGATGSAGQTGNVFPKAADRRLGYKPADVEAFVERARETYVGAAGASSAVTAGEVREASFPVVKGGYSVRHVDAALDRLEDVFYERERRVEMRENGEKEWWDETRSLLSDVRGRIGRPAGKRLRRRGVFASGYRRSQVDAFLDSVGDMFARREISMTPAEVRETVFHSEWRGYDEDQVDALLDAIVELILATR
ncbi:DivIVA domain-containing protein [Leucobacter sp. cx-328]|uniref:DivIVA domain-containing protein n=1 Tax=unclassified Leucobacter TaxID=2621730 RepID=UPI00165E7490|nr:MULTISPECIES: DivIVA domain-containing protein [unclassified Leucobacter]MBC9944418.1 DivIVA domain-containing protein [Leucobacter sp. cx-328]